MSKFSNDAFEKAFRSGVYICPKCGKQMQFEDEYEDTLVCLHCGYDEDIDHYGFTDEEYNDLYSVEPPAPSFDPEDDWYE